MNRATPTIADSEAKPAGPAHLVLKPTKRKSPNLFPIELKMFNTISQFHHTLSALRGPAPLIPDICATIGQCSTKTPTLRDPLTKAWHKSDNGLYSADQVKKFRNCSNNYTLKFDPIIKFDPKITKEVIAGYKPQGGNAIMESFRMCWDEIQLH